MAVSFTRRRGDIIPTQNGGFADVPSRSAYPEAWRGLVFAYEPGLGRDIFRDYSGNGHVLTFEGGMSIAADFMTTQSYANANAPPGFAMDFDGVNDALNWGSGSSMDNIFDDGGTVLVWVYASGDGEGGSPRVVDKGSTATPTSTWSLLRNTANTQFRFIYDFNGPSEFANFSSPVASFPLNTWVHCAATYNSNDGANDARMWINGAEVTVTANNNPTGTRQDDSSRDLRMGGTDVSANRNFDGGIAGVRLYQRELDSAEIRQQYEIPLAPYILGRRYWQIPAAGRIMSSLVGHGGLVAEGGLAGRGGGLAA